MLGFIRRLYGSIFRKVKPAIPRIPDDLIPEILLKLPAQSIHRFRIVCKSWLKIIQSSFFIKAQVEVEKTARNKSINNSFIVVPGSQGTTLYSVVFHSSDNLEVVSVVKELDYPTMDGKKKSNWLAQAMKSRNTDSKKKVKLVGSCNGLICLQNTNLPPDRVFFEYPPCATSFTLWNPSTGIYRVVADESDNPVNTWKTSYVHSFDSYCYFGYDQVKDDYHVVRVTMLDSKPNGFVLSIYSLKNRSWTKINKQDHDWVIVRSGVFTAGTLYLISIQKINDTPPFYPKIIAFDVSTQSFRLIELPPNNRVFQTYDDVTSIQLSEWDGRLIMMDCPCLLLPRMKQGVWLMNNDNNGGIEEETWSKTCEIETSMLPMCTTKLLLVTSGGGGSEDVVVGFFYVDRMKWCECHGQNKETLVQRPSTEENFLYMEACVCLRTVASPFVVESINN